jgi:hypothetical protein
VASVDDAFPVACESVSTTSVAAGGATGNTAGPFAGDIDDTLAMPAGSSVTYTAVCDVALGATGTLTNTATIASAVTDPEGDDNSATDDDTVISEPGMFFTLTPCRLLDTRLAAPVLSSGVDRTLVVPPTCGVPTTARALALNLTVVSSTGAGHLTARAGGTVVPSTSVLNFGSGQTRANNAVVPLPGSGIGTVSFRASVGGAGTVHLIVDVVGYFE